MTDKNITNKNVSETDFGKKSCDTCLFYVDSMPHLVICIAGKRIKEYTEIKMNCKKWVEDTPENAERELKKIKL